MLRRNSKHRQRRPLSRSKSAYSVLRDPVDQLELINPATARRDAHIAATLSYQRAHGGLSSMAHQSGASEDIAALESRAGRHTAGSRQLKSEGASIEVGSAPPWDLKRQQSIRLTGPKARLKRNLAPRASRHQTTSSSKDDSYEPVCNTQTLRGIAEAHGKPFGFHSLTKNYLRSLKAVAADETTEGSSTTVQPCHSKLRKSRSMFTSLNAEDTGYYFSNDTPPQQGQIRRSRSRYASLNPQTEKKDQAWASDLVPGPFAEISRPLSQPSKDLALQLAREKFQQHIELQQQHQNNHLLKPQPSVFLRSKNKRSESSMALRKSLRQSSNTSAALSSALSGQSLTLSKHSGLRNTARRVSQSLRSKVKHLFNRPKLSGDFGLSYDKEFQGSHDERESGLGEDSLPVGEASLSCVASHVPSLHAVPSVQQMHSRKGSVESLDPPVEHADDDKSRVTSWTNSITNTVHSQSAVGEWERQRLSVIKENGTHVSSPSLVRPLQGLSPEVNVNSERVYAALMKRLAETREEETSQHSQDVEAMAMRSTIPPHTGSAEHFEVPTIRCVAADDDVFSDDRSPRDALKEVSLSFNATPESRETTLKPGPPLSPSKLVQGSPRSFRSKTISHRSSAFFGSPSTYLFRTTSPYRRALQQEMHKPTSAASEGAPDNNLYPSTLSPLAIPPRRPSTIVSENWKTKASEGSVYSAKDDDTAGNPWNTEAAIVDNFPRPPTASNSPAFEQTRAASTVSSVEWKRWLSSDVANHEEMPRDVIGLGHVREQAQIESPDERQKAELRTGKPIQGTPLRPIAPNSRSSSAMKISQNPWEEAMLKSENDRPSPQTNVSIHKTPPIPARSALRVVPSSPEAAAAAGGGQKYRASSTPAEPWPLTLSVKPADSCGPSVSAERRVKSRLNNVTTYSAYTSPLLPPPKDLKRPSTASPGHRSNRALERTLNRLHLRDRTNGPGRNDAAAYLSPVTGSKKMVDMFISSRRRKGHETTSRSTSDSSPAAFL